MIPIEGLDLPQPGVGWTVATTAEEEPLDVDPVDVTPGLLGFLVTLAVVVASILLLRSMTAKVRGVRRRDRERGHD